MLHVGEENYFGDTLRGGGVRYDENRLTLHDSGFDLDLRRIRGNGWSGRFHRKEFDSVVTLIRPRNKARTKKAWPVGTWKEGRSGPGETCLHIAETAAGDLTGWSDTLLAGALRGLRLTYQSRHTPWNVTATSLRLTLLRNGAVSVELSAYTAICCSHRFAATPAKNGTVMSANWAEGPNQASHKSEWSKMPGDTCIVPVE